MNTFDPSQFSNNCAPIHSDDSIFFNLILNSNYENTKENCLLFLRNYSKQILYTKREIFRIIINELTLGEQTNLDIRKDESIYLIHQIIKKYSRNNIINALYDFISLNEGENEKKNNLINKEKNTNNSNSTDDFSNDKSQNHERGQSKKDIQKILNIIQKKDKKKKDKKESHKENEDSIDNSEDGSIFDNDNNSDINSSKLVKLLEKKRKSASFIKKAKKAKKDQKEKKENKEKEEKEEKNGQKIKKCGKKEKENKDKNEEEYEKGQEKDKEEEEQGGENIFNEKEMDKRDINEDKEKARMDSHENTKKKKEKEKENLHINNDIVDFEKEGKIKVKDKIHIKKEENIMNEENEGTKYQRRSYKNRIRNMSSLSPFKSFVSKSTRRIISPIEIIKLESVEELNYDSNITIFPKKNKKLKEKRKSANQIDILSYLNMNKSKDSNTLNEQEKQFGNHLIKAPKEKQKEFIYSYRIKKYQSFNKRNIILFECNNNKCQGRGEYEVERKIFRETVEHNVSANFHNLAFVHYNVKQTLLMDDCLGYQLFKDNNTFIKDKKVIMLNNK